MSGNLDETFTWPERHLAAPPAPVLQLLPDGCTGWVCHPEPLDAGPIFRSMGHHDLWLLIRHDTHGWALASTWATPANDRWRISRRTPMYRVGVDQVDPDTLDRIDHLTPGTEIVVFNPDPYWWPTLAGMFRDVLRLRLHAPILAAILLLARDEEPDTGDAEMVLLALTDRDRIGEVLQHLPDR